MTTKEEEAQKEVQNPEEQNAENPEEEKEEEEEPVDIELQKEMKGLKIEDSDFSNEPKTKKAPKKPKNSEGKKSKKKGQDFIDYANKNNIQLNIEYETKKYQPKKKDDQKGGNKYTDNKKPFNKGGYKNDKNYQQKRNPIYSGNKFDNFSQVKPYQNYHQQSIPKLVENKDILEYLEKFFGEENLNKNTYIRNRLSDGKILVEAVEAYNDLKRNNINSQKIMEVIKDSKTLECVNEDNKNYIKIKNFDQLKLLTIEQIIEKNKAMKMQKPQFMPMYPSPFNYIAMQNNYYFPPYYNNQVPYYPVEYNK